MNIRLMLTALLASLLSSFPHPGEASSVMRSDADNAGVGVSEVPLADPYILLDGDTYYAYGTNDPDGIAVWTSTDLLRWTKRATLALHKEQTSERQWFWAPEVYRLNDRYYMFYSANEHLYVATATSPLGPFRQQGSCMTKAMLGDEKCIDSSLFIDDDGQAWLFFVRFTDGNCIWMCQLNDDYTTLRPASLKKCINVSQSWEDRMGRVNEGPFVLKHGGIYYLTYSGNDYRSQDYAVGYAQSRTLSASTSWSKYTGNPIVRRVEDLLGTGHHSFFTDKEGRLRIVFHAHHSASEVAPRLMYIGTMEFVGNRLQLSNESIIRPVDATRHPEGGLEAVHDVWRDTQPCGIFTLQGLPASSACRSILISQGRKYVR